MLLTTFISILEAHDANIISSLTVQDVVKFLRVAADVVVHSEKSLRLTTPRPIQFLAASLPSFIHPFLESINRSFPQLNAAQSAHRKDRCDEPESRILHLNSILGFSTQLHSNYVLISISFPSRLDRPVLFIHSTHQPRLPLAPDSTYS
ncbi:hypothetical protein PGT21_036077 [Puccinia graminis f. sp. tritici]|uniref:Uncharacterized protein n=1 Tax=Puccinia graminis f. sp. tritici TaxID=56615 RepID=A0A5B0R6X0_PUCGR|nr:hypothetical protein PGT21_036077 [Puccinia graminis f. sp. tritici]KAA1121416.1 hypothetical protein PGTUg99_023135 [Puccinia graminis f. sp. tritici]